jgi:hypothetical protein
VTGERRARSNVSLAYLEDMGWYMPEYAAAEPLAHGYLQGADFAVNPPNLVGRCRLTLSKAVLKAHMVLALGATV